MSDKTKKFILNVYFWVLLVCTVMNVTTIGITFLSNVTDSWSLEIYCSPSFRHPQQ